MRIGLTLVLLFLALPSFAFDLNKVKIISAEKLDYKDGNSTLIGDVKIQLGDYFLTAPKVIIDSNDEGKPHLAKFFEDVTLESKDLTITAPEMHIDLINTKFKCFSGPDAIVQTNITDKKGKGAVVMADYQEFDYNTGFAKASAADANSANDTLYKNSLNKVIFLHDKLQIESKHIEMQTENKKVEFIDFFEEAVAVDEKQRTEAEHIMFFPDQDLIKAENEVKIVYADKEPAFIFSDMVIFEKAKRILSAFSKANEPRSKIYRKDSYGQARQIVLNLDKDLKPDNAILTGRSYSQLADKALMGHELLFDIKKQKLKTLVGRPKTLLFSSNK